MSKIILTFGAIAGLISGGMFFVMHSDTPNYDSGMIVGYLTMIIGLSTIFFATKQYRDKYNSGAINFGKAFKIGIGITLVATALYVLCWEIYYNTLASDFTGQYLAYLREGMEAEGKTAEAIASELAPTETMMEQYKSNRLIRMGMTSVEIIPVGLILTLISSVLFGKILKK